LEPQSLSPFIFFAVESPCFLLITDEDKDAKPEEFS